MDFSDISLEWVTFGVFGVVAVVLLLVFGVQRPTLTTTAVVRSKTYKPPSSYRPFAHGSSRGFRTLPAVAIAASYSLELDAEGLGAVRGSVNEVMAKGINVGDRVNIKYQVRGLLGVWKKVYVYEVSPIQK